MDLKLAKLKGTYYFEIDQKFKKVDMIFLFKLLSQMNRTIELINKRKSYFNNSLRNKNK